MNIKEELYQALLNTCNISNETSTLLQQLLNLNSDIKNNYDLMLVIYNDEINIIKNDFEKIWNAYNNGNFSNIKYYIIYKLSEYAIQRITDIQISLGYNSQDTQDTRRILINPDGMPSFAIGKYQHEVQLVQ